MFAVDLKALKPGVYHRSQRASAEDLELDAVALSAAGFAEMTDLPVGRPDGPTTQLGEIDVKLTLTLSSGQLLVDVSVEADGWLVCDRTLEPYSQHIAGEHHVYCAEADEAEAGTGEFIPLESGQEELDLTSVVRDTVLLSVPLRRVSPAGEELEIATRFGAGDGTDPRWDALKALRNPGDATEDRAGDGASVST